MIIPELNETARMKHALRSKILLLVIYLSFISIGLPDGVLGVAWP
jgi:hypothetical protein